MKKASVMTVRLPADLKQRIDIIADEQGVSLNQLAMYIFAKEVASFEAGNKISEYWQGYDKNEILQSFDDVMRYLFEKYVEESQEYISEDMLLKAINTTTNDNYDQFFNVYIYGNDLLPCVVERGNLIIDFSKIPMDH